MRIQRIPGLEVTIIVNGQRLREYTHENEAPTEATEATCYIESKPNTRFQVLVSVGPLAQFEQGECFLIPVNIDGENPSSTNSILELKRKPSDSRGVQSYNIRGATRVKGDELYLYNYCFADLDISEDARLADIDSARKTKLAKLGEIDVALTRIIKKGLSKPASKGRKATDMGTVPEKALKGKAISQQIKFVYVTVLGGTIADVSRLDRGESYGPSTVWNSTSLDKKPFATFRFKYRSIDSLKALGVVPRSPSPIPLEDRSIDDLTANELRERLREQEVNRQCFPYERSTNGQQALNRRIKQEKVKREFNDITTAGDTDGDDDVVVVGGRVSKRSRLGNGNNGGEIEVIELSDNE
ncbi:hypothetical protein P152DRAFT_451361 [Eremomyces bilateralis CBS 781.70]|uniref:DUF7918 domain-containing protein n=1 Tax=Eremomyces bilateralis CBS 781.70 TaxID=1392243 RepID=A0A6G1FX40_9PEZI|nr:uncharacterized protein P152DRAFT_451361 [Eremomyces bilateralis CBS 781.70]KAF1810272.1 hypothetical protein P152DRAFT_451361 [Eremomyces bilateralis CBS 781.70]